MSQERSRTYNWLDPMPWSNAGAGMAGLDYMKAIASGEFPAAPMAQTLGFQLEFVEEGHAVFVCQPQEFHYNPIGGVHGGLAATLLDSAMGCAVHTTLPQGMAYATVQMNINLLRPLTASTGTIRSEARVIHSGRSTATAEGKVIDEKGKVFAHGTVTCMVFPLPQP